MPPLSCPFSRKSDRPMVFPPCSLLPFLLHQFANPQTQGMQPDEAFVRHDNDLLADLFVSCLEPAFVLSLTVFTEVAVLPKLVERQRIAPKVLAFFLPEAVVESDVVSADAAMGELLDAFLSVLQRRDDYEQRFRDFSFPIAPR